MPRLRRSMAATASSPLPSTTGSTSRSRSRPPAEATHRIYNLGANRSEDILHVIKLFERALGKEAKIELKPGDPSDMQETSADITDTERDFGWSPKVSVE